jgi:predicted thioesterase
MKPDFTPGLTAEVRFTVTESMLAGFEGEVIHPVLGTVWLVYHLELAGRRIILPYLEAHEEGIGHAISLVHRAPAPLGSTVTVIATLTSYSGNRVVTALEARLPDGTVVADGVFTQVILPKDVIRARLTRGS